MKQLIIITLIFLVGQVKAYDFSAYNSESV